MIQIDFDADLNWVDDEDRNIAKLEDAPTRYKIGDVAIAGRPGFWSWVLIDEIDGAWVFFRQISRQEAEQRGRTVLPANV
ncbi:MAG: hypothetical protein HZY75_02390 [Nocardioidaceae bacterium]|nr:MAG: hypothetical protein HZY75_02390 [Nocardioidaceae bacterium]